MANSLKIKTQWLFPLGLQILEHGLGNHCSILTELQGRLVLKPLNISNLILIVKAFFLNFEFITCPRVESKIR